jgi:M6 family metalloprotease-like protein
MDEALEYLSQSMDLSIYDSDNNSMIDAVVLISTNEINGEHDFTWAARYWNFYTDDNGYKFKYDDVSANDYVWCPYQFMFEKEEGKYDGYDIINPLTFIHEFSHVLGADDYYNYNGSVSPLENHDIMDSMYSDHNPYTKFNYGWIKNSKLIVTDSSVTLNLNSFIETGETIIIANNWDATLGAYQEYYILMYYKNESLNLVDNVGLFKDEGILMYHVNASLFFDEVYGYNVYNNNSTIYGGDYDGTEDNLIEFVKYTGYQIIYTQGCTSSADIIDDQGNKISYTFTVDSLTDEYATITFNKNN